MLLISLLGWFVYSKFVFINIFHRGGGFISLENLLFFAKNYPVHHFLSSFVVFSLGCLKKDVQCVFFHLH